MRQRAGAPRTPAGARPAGSARAQWRRGAGLTHQSLDEATVVVDPSGREIHLLNETAGRVWELCASPCSFEDLVTALRREFRAPAEEVRDGVWEVLRALGERRLVLLV